MNLGYSGTNVEFRKGLADAMPVDDSTIDLVISNCVINLTPDKQKVFREMYRVLKPGGRFTISDIVADAPVPNYLLHDSEKWGDCLSGALPVSEYLGGLTQSGFRGVHQIKFMPYQSIDGIQFLSLTITGYKIPAATATTQMSYATLRGPFSAVVDEFEQKYQRGVPQAIDAQTAKVLASSGCTRLFILSDSPTPLLPSDPRLVAIFPADEPCVWKGHFALLTGPLVEAVDDDHHIYRRGVPLEICSKTVAVLETESYHRYFAIVNRAGHPVTGAEVTCTPDGCC